MDNAKRQVSVWLKTAYAQREHNKFTHMLVALDTVTFDYYPIYVSGLHDLATKIGTYHSLSNKSKVIEVYDLSLGMTEQLEEENAWHPSFKDIEDYRRTHGIA